MSPIHTSSAFLQQCFAVHPLCLTFKTYLPPDKIGIFCTNCHMRHRITLDLGTVSPLPEGFLQSVLSPCRHDHPESLRISAVEMDENIVHFRCGECQQTYRLLVSLVETHMT